MTENQPSAARLRVHHREDPKPYRDRYQTSGSFFADLDGSAAALREAAQNAIDAAEGTSVPVIAVEILRLSAARMQALAPLLADADHWRAVGEGLPLPGHTRKALVISDFGGSGLTGDARAIGTAEADRLGAFWRTSGRSNKTNIGATGGRFGVGKDTFQHASGSRTFIALSRERDGRTRLLGQAGLGPRTTPDGTRWTDVSDIGGEIDPESGLVLPLEGTEAKYVDGVIGLGEMRARDARRHGLPDTGVSIAILDPADLPGEMTLAQFVRAVLGPLLVVGRLRLLVGGEEIRAEEIREIDGLLFGPEAADPQILDDLVLEDDWEAGIRDWAEASGADPTRPLRVDVVPEGQADLAVRILLVPRGGHLRSGWYGIRRGAFVLQAPQGRSVDGATVLLDVRGDRISKILAYAEGPSHSRWEMEQARLHLGRGRKSEKDLALVFRILGLPRMIWSDLRREEAKDNAIPMDGFASTVEALLGPISTSGRTAAPDGRPGSVVPGGTVATGGNGRNGGQSQRDAEGWRGSAPPAGAFNVTMAPDGTLTIHWNHPDGHLYLVAAPSNRRIPVDLQITSPDGSAEGRWNREAGLLEIRRTGPGPALLHAAGWPNTIALHAKRSAA